MGGYSRQLVNNFNHMQDNKPIINDAYSSDAVLKDNEPSKERKEEREASIVFFNQKNPKWRKQSSRRSTWNRFRSIQTVFPFHSSLTS